MTEPTSDWVGSISDLIAEQIRDLRRREGLSREELSERARGVGLPASFSAVALGNIETGRRDHDGRRRREVTVDELAALAAAADRSPLDLLGPAAEVFATETVGCRRCARGPGSVEAAVSADVERLGELDGVQGSLVATSRLLARRLDEGGGEDGKQVPQLAKELRATLELLAGGADSDSDEGDDEFGDLDQPE